jgi:hypothetical protein
VLKFGEFRLAAGAIVIPLREATTPRTFSASTAS